VISGVKIKKLKVWADKPDIGQKDVKQGYLMEVLRADEGLINKFGQTTFTVAYKGTIKAFHWHKYQDDLWFIATGRAKVVLYDRREKSPTFGQTQVIEAGVNNFKLIVIPRGVAHGYQVLSKEPVLLFYHVTKAYNRDNPDEEHIGPYDKKINFNWNEI